MTAWPLVWTAAALAAVLALPLVLLLAVRAAGHGVRRLRRRTARVVASRRRFLRQSVGQAASGALALTGAGVAVTVLDGCVALGGSPRGERLARMKKSPNYANGRFRNLYPIGRFPVGKILGRFLRRSPHRNPRAPVTASKRSAADFARAPAGGLRVTWLGHSTALIELDGARLLTDPIWSTRAGPAASIGTKRFFAPPLPLDQLPALDAVIISHDHYDHLDMATIRQLARTGARFVVPLGVGAHLERWKVPAERIVELDWWESTTVGKVRLVATPARHGSGRSVTDRNRTLWASWSLLGPRHRVFFSGDGGYSPSFAEIGRRFGPFDVTLVESGAYNALWCNFHLGPEQAVAAHRDLRGKLMLPIHWATFNLALHGWTEPAERLRMAAAKAGGKLAIPKPGQSVDPTAPPPLRQWWPKLPWETAAQAPVVSTLPAGHQLLHRRRPHRPAAP